VATRGVSSHFARGNLIGDLEAGVDPKTIFKASLPPEK